MKEDRHIALEGSIKWVILKVLNTKKDGDDTLEERILIPTDQFGLLFCETPTMIQCIKETFAEPEMNKEIKPHAHDISKMKELHIIDENNNPVNLHFN